MMNQAAGMRRGRLPKVALKGRHSLPGGQVPSMSNVEGLRPAKDGGRRSRERKTGVR
jgi:hypothetical protein